MVNIIEAKISYFNHGFHRFYLCPQGTRIKNLNLSEIPALSKGQAQVSVKFVAYFLPIAFVAFSSQSTYVCNCLIKGSYLLF